MLGWTVKRDAELALEELLHDKELEILRIERDQAKEYARKAENLVDYWKQHADAERDRADRLADALNQQNGLPETTNTVIRETKERVDKSMDEFQKRQNEVSELFAESINTTFDGQGLELTPELADAAQALLSTVKKS